MPQFDSSSFIVQLIWMFVSFLSFYFLFSLNYLPFWGVLKKIKEKNNNFIRVFDKHFENNFLVRFLTTLKKKLATTNNNKYF